MKTPITSDRLGPEFIHQVIYCMENQEKRFVLDLDTLEFLECGQGEPLEDSCITLPLWKPTDGFRMMEEFTLSLDNAFYKEKLRSVIQEGSGVFRNFKNVLNESGWLEKQWRIFKSRYMYRIVMDWVKDIETLQEMLSLENEEPLDDDLEMLLEDFTITSLATPDYDKAIAFLQHTVKESPHLFTGDPKHISELSSLSQITFVVRDPMGEIVSIFGVYAYEPNRYRVLLGALDCRVDGIGLWEQLFVYVRDHLEQLGAKEFITSELPYSEYTDSTLSQLGFSREMVRYKIDFK